MKRIKKMMALVIALVMCMSLALPAMAATGAQTLDGTISVSGLEEGDSVTFYRVLKFDQNATTTGGWSADTGFTTLTAEQIRKMLAIEVTGTDPNFVYKQVAITEENKDKYGIDATLAGTIADLAEATGVDFTKYEATASAAGVASKDNPSEGLYVAIITPAKAGIVYNPVFVGADYQNNSSNTWAVNMNDSYQPASVAKKAEIKVDKTAKDDKTVDANYSETVSAGDVLTFTVITTIPEFADNYTNPVFNVTDALSTGLELKTTTIKVYEASIDAGVYSKGTEITASAGTTITFTIPEADLSTSGYKVVFDPTYIKNLNAAQPIVIEYQAEVTSAAVTSVNVFDNTVTVNFSNAPTDEEGHGTIKDETKHYTFDIDANLLGTENETNPWKTVEVVKVGLDKDGKEITVENVTWHKDEATQPKIGALEGAEFELYKEVKTGEEPNVTINKVKYTNKYITDTTKIVSDSTGRLTIQGSTDGIKGLDAGTYYLRETKAPDGYIKMQDDVKIEIIPMIEEVTKTEGTVTWKYNELKSYTIKINDVQTASYTMTNEKPNKGDTIVGSDTLIGADSEGLNAASGKITNTQGVELPSTGGIGTTIFYIVGAILVLGAGILLVSKRRMQAR